MRHAGDRALDRIEPLLVSLRATAELREVSRGRFYRGSKAFLHFHEDGDDLFADVRLATEFERVRVTSKAEQTDLLAQIRRAL